MGTTEQQSTLPLGEHVRWTSIYNLQTSPVPAEQLEDYRKTTIRFKDGATNTFKGKCQSLEEPSKAQPQMWKAKLPDALQQQFATKTQPRSEPRKVTPQVIHYNTTNTTGVNSTTYHQRCSWTRTSTSFRSTPWRRLLVQRRPIREERTC